MARRHWAWLFSGYFWLRRVRFCFFGGHPFTLDEIFPGIYDEHANLNLIRLAEIIGIDVSEFANLIEVDLSQVYQNQVRRNRDIIGQVETLVTTLNRAAKARQDVRTTDDVRGKVMPLVCYFKPCPWECKTC